MTLISQENTFVLSKVRFQLLRVTTMQQQQTKTTKKPYTILKFHFKIK